MKCSPVAVDAKMPSSRATRTATAFVRKWVDPRRRRYIAVEQWNIISKAEARRDSREEDSGPRGLFYVDGSSASTRPSRWQVRRALATKATASSELSAGVAEVCPRRHAGESTGTGDVVPAAVPSGAIPEGGRRRRGRAGVVVVKRKGKSGGLALPGRGTAMSSRPPLVEDPVSGAGNAWSRRVRARGEGRVKLLFVQLWQRSSSGRTRRGDGVAGRLSLRGMICRLELADSNDEGFHDRKASWMRQSTV